MIARLFHCRRRLHGRRANHRRTTTVTNSKDNTHLALICCPFHGNKCVLQGDARRALQAAYIQQFLRLKLKFGLARLPLPSYRVNNPHNTCRMPLAVTLPAAICHVVVHICDGVSYYCASRLMWGMATSRHSSPSVNETGAGARTGLDVIRAGAGCDLSLTCDWGEGVMASACRGLRVAAGQFPGRSGRRYAQTGALAW